MRDHWTPFRRKAAMIIAMTETDKHNAAVRPVNDILDKIDQLQGLPAGNNQELDWRETFIVARQAIRNENRYLKQMQS